MEKNKVTSTERQVLKKMAVVGAYIVPGNFRRSMCEVRYLNVSGPVLQFRERTLQSLKEKGLIDVNNEITQSGGKAAVKGFY